MAPRHANDQRVNLPFTCRLAQPLQIGQTINIHGKINPDGKRIELNLLKGDSELAKGQSQALLHANIRIDEATVVLNSFLDGKWGDEERVANPFKAGEDFDLRIRCLDGFFEVRLNGEKVHEFKYRSPFNETEFLQVKGDCIVDGVHWGGKLYQVPWETAFQGQQPLKLGSRIELYVIPKGDRWTVDFIAKNKETLFHFNPRMAEKKLVRNARKGGFWMKEELDFEGDFPFQLDGGATLVLINETEAIQIEVDGRRVCSFKHRATNPISDYIGFRIDGPVEVTNMDFQYPQ
ncbi:unnamed protein product, partial [Mesorhabditis belari]|uniref:Galectin n=1 Tax=Mesorhabditis belari TaxID=2138241 RepID=A0AAF3EBB2_9BILA